MMPHRNACESIVKAVRAGMTLRRAADLAGYGVAEVIVAMGKDPVFAAELRQAQAELEFELLQKMSGATQWQAWRFLLQALYPARYATSRKSRGQRRRRRVEPNEQRLARLTADELARLEPLVLKMDGKAPDAATAEPRANAEGPR